MFPEYRQYSIVIKIVYKHMGKKSLLVRYCSIDFKEQEKIYKHNN